LPPTNQPSPHHIPTIPPPWRRRGAEEEEAQDVTGAGAVLSALLQDLPAAADPKLVCFDGVTVKNGLAMVSQGIYPLVI